jgi:chitodextrinase
MKKRLLLMFVFVCASLLYGVANAQTYEGSIGAEDWKTVGTPQDSEEGYAPDFSYQISVVDEGKLQVTVDMSATCVGLVPQLFVKGGYLMDLNPVAGSSSQFANTTSDVYEIGETLSVSFYFAYAGGISDTNPFDYVVGSTNEALDDSEAPVVSMFELEGVSTTKADVRLLVTDNLASSVKVEFSVDDFASVLNSQKVAAGTETVCTLSGLTPETTYDLKVRATDDADNVSEVKTLSFSTLDADAECYYYGVVATEEEWNEKGGGYVPVINYVVKTTADNKLEFTMTLDSGTTGLVNPEIWVDGVNTATTPTGEALTYTGITGASFERGTTVNFYFRLVHAGGVSSTHAIPFEVGSANEKPAEDVEAPVLNSVTAGNVTGYSADITVNATDNQSASLTVEVASDEAFESVLATSRVASGEDGVCTLDNLTPLTEYTLYVRVSDLAGNVSDVKTVTFTTLEPADAVAFVGSIAADGWAVTGTPEGETEVFAPSVSYEIVTTRENRLQFRLSLDRVCVGMGVEVWINGEPFFGLQQPAAENAVNIFEGENSRSYPRGTKLNIRFRFPFAGGVSETKPFEFEVGSKSGGSSVDDFVADAVRVYGANGELRVCGASGSQCCVYDLSGRLVMSCLVDGQEAVYSLNKGLYVVVVGGSVSKVVL